MGEFRRRLMMQAVSAGHIPDGWNEVEYIDILNTEIFDSGIVPTANMAVELKASGWTNDYAHSCVFGVYAVYAFWIGSSNWKFTHGNNTISAADEIEPPTYYNGRTVIFKKKGVHNHLTIFASRNSNKIIYDKDISDNTGTFTATSKTIYIGTANDTPTWATNPMQFNYAKIWSDDNVLLRDFIPVSNGTEDALYDKVSKQLFYKITV